MSLFLVGLDGLKRSLSLRTPKKLTNIKYVKDIGC